MLLHNYPYTSLDYSSALKHLDPLHYLPGRYLFCWCSQWMVQFLNIVYLFFLSASIAPVSAPCPTTFIIFFTGMYGSLQSQRLAFSIMVLNLIWLFALYVQGSSSFTSIQFFVLSFKIDYQCYPAFYDLLVLHFFFIFISITITFQKQFFATFLVVCMFP